MASSALYAMYDAEPRPARRHNRTAVQDSEQESDSEDSTPGMTLAGFLFDHVKRGITRSLTMTKADELREALDASMVTLEAEIAKRKASIDTLEGRMRQKAAEAGSRLARMGIRKETLPNLTKQQLVNAASRLFSMEDAAERKRMVRAIAIEKSYLANVEHFRTVLSDALKQCTMEQMSEQLQKQLKVVARLADTLGVNQMTRVVNGIHHKVAESVAKGRDTMMEFRELQQEDADERRADADMMEDNERKENAAEIGTDAGADMTEHLNMLADMMGEPGDRDLAAAGVEGISVDADTANAASVLLNRVLGSSTGSDVGVSVGSGQTKRKHKVQNHRDPAEDSRRKMNQTVGPVLSQRREQPAAAAAAAAARTDESQEDPGIRELRERFRALATSGHGQKRDRMQQQQQQQQQLLVTSDEEEPLDEPEAEEDPYRAVS